MVFYGIRGSLGGISVGLRSISGVPTGFRMVRGSLRRSASRGLMGVPDGVRSFRGSQEVLEVVSGSLRGTAKSLRDV